MAAASVADVEAQKLPDDYASDDDPQALRSDARPTGKSMTKRRRMAPVVAPMVDSAPKALDIANDSDSNNTKDEEEDGESDVTSSCCNSSASSSSSSSSSG